MFFLKRILVGFVVFGTTMLVFVHAQEVQPDCSGVNDGVVVCDLGKDKKVYAECYQEKALQNIGDNNAWIKQKPSLFHGLDQQDIKKYIDKKIIKIQSDCTPLKFETASYQNPQGVSSWKLPIEVLRFALGLVLLLIVLLIMRHRKENKK